jgi:hypothetical protein
VSQTLWPATTALWSRCSVSLNRFTHFPGRLTTTVFGGFLHPLLRDNVTRTGSVPDPLLGLESGWVSFISWKRQVKIENTAPTRPIRPRSRRCRAGDGSCVDPVLDQLGGGGQRSQFDLPFTLSIRLRFLGLTGEINGDHGTGRNSAPDANGFLPLQHEPITEHCGQLQLWSRQCDWLRKP